VTGVFLIGAEVLGAAVALGAAVPAAAGSLAVGAAEGAAVGALVGEAVGSAEAAPAAGARVLCSKNSMLSKANPVTSLKQTVRTCGPAGISIAAAL
jgi:hypothetical protein